MKKLFCTVTVLGVLAVFCSRLYADSMTLQPGAAEGQDTKINSATPYGVILNYGTSNDINVRNNVVGVTRYALIKFDLSAIPVNSTITSAFMEIFCYQDGLSLRSTVDAYRITSDWAELGVTWNTQPTIDSSTSVTNLGGNPAKNNWIAWDITDYVDGWYSGDYENYGLELKNNVNASENFFRSSDEPNASLHPKLTITYEEAVPEPEPVPEPATLVLLGLGLVGLVRKK